MRGPAKDRTGPHPAPAVAGLKAYSVPRPDLPVDLHLDANEGSTPPTGLLEGLQEDVDSLRRYPRPGRLEGALAGRLGIEAERVLVTDGSNDALDRACRAVLAPGRNGVLTVPGFDMTERYARLTGAEVRRVEWMRGPYPLEEVMGATDGKTAAVVVTSPNNPTGAATSVEVMETLARRLPRALVVADLAYVEFAESDPTPRLLELPNVLAVRTFSKAWGLAGLRVGWAAGETEVLRWMRIAGQNYPVSALSREAALRCLKEGNDDVQAYCARVREERDRLARLLEQRGADPFPSQANFVLAQFEDPARVQLELARRGIMVRAFPGSPLTSDCLRITCPGDDAAFARLTDELKEILP
ncbi:MAG: histidinol-phosphate transaminase [bacterium]